jgi:hypothetical protein
LKRVLIVLFCLLLAGIGLGCSGSPSSSSAQTSGVKYRAFITNNVSAGSLAAGVYIVDAAKDLRGTISPISAGNTPEMMVLTPNRAQTVVFSGNGTQFSDNVLTLINNASESAYSHVTLPGRTESFVVTPDSSSVYVALPTAPLVGQSPGLVEAISLNSGGVSGQVSVPGVHFLAINNGGDRLLGFSDNSDSVAVITPSQIGIPGPPPPVVSVGGFDRPIAAFFSSDGTTAYIVNCGAECGGTIASVQPFNLITNTPGTAVPVPAATVALVSSSTMYLAGTPNAQACPSNTQATTCGLITVFDLNQMAITNTAPIVITDGYHDRIALAANGQLFVGARTCTEIIPPVPAPSGAETRGCLSIYNIQTGAVVIPPANGDVTGIEPIAKRTVVYVVQGGSLGIYNTATAALQTTTQITDLVGQFYDVKTIDF